MRFQDRPAVRTLRRSLRFVRNFIRPQVIVTPAPESIRVDWNVPVKMRDGTVLRVNVFRPQGAGQFPILMSAHPYGKDKIPANTRSGRGAPLQSRLLPQPHPTRISSYTSWEAPDPAVWVREGYIVVNADLRGGGKSEGVGDLFSDEEAQDYYELIEWAGTQPWSTGRVGLDGVSYLAISQYKVAALRPPHLAAICPWEGLSDLYRDFARPGGVLEQGFNKLWSWLTGKEARVRTSLYEASILHTERDAWYAERTPQLERIEVPVLICGSFSDHLLHTRGSFEVFLRAGSAQKWMYTHRSGKWCEYYSEEATKTRIRFFDHFLKGKNNGWEQEARVRLAITESGPDPVAITGELSWPPAGARWQKLWLDAHTGSIRSSESQTGASRAVRLPKGRLNFAWTVPEDIDVLGHMALYLHIELQQADDALLFVAVRKLEANGAESIFEGSYGFSGDMVSKGWQRAAHRELEPSLTTPEQPVYTHRRIQPYGQGEIVPVAVALRPHATRLRKGDRLRIDIQGRWFFPRSKLGGQFPADYQQSGKATCIVHTGPLYPSYLLLATRDPVQGAAR